MLLFSAFAPKIIKTFLHFPGEVTAQVPKTEIYCEVKPPLPGVPGGQGDVSAQVARRASSTGHEPVRPAPSAGREPIGPVLKPDGHRDPCRR